MLHHLKLQDYCHSIEVELTCEEDVHNETTVVQNWTISANKHTGFCDVDREVLSF